MLPLVGGKKENGRQFMEVIGNFLIRHLNWNDITGALTMIGLVIFLVRRFILHKSPIPEEAFVRKVSKELLQECVDVLKEQDREPYDPYTVPYDIILALQEDLRNEKLLKRLLDSICDHLGMEGKYVRLVVEDKPAADYAGNISTNGAFTTVRLELKKGSNVDGVIAVLAHEAVHLHLFYKGIALEDQWENEILTDTATIYYGFGDYMYRGYSVMRDEFALTYRKIGYITQKDIQYISSII